MDFSDKLKVRVGDLIGRKVETFLPVQGGYTQAFRKIALFDDGGTAFVKCATDKRTGDWLCSEISVYQHLSGPFMSAALAWDAADPPLLVLEDLRDCVWPPPWDTGRVDAVLESLSQIHASQIDVPQYQDIFTHRGWHLVAENPESFLSIGIADEAWLAKCLPTLLEAHDSVDPTGSALCHFDVRSDNICFRNGQAILIDWNNACTANPDLDIAYWLLSLRLEGGPLPQEILPDAGGLASYLTGYFASRAGLPDPPHTTLIRKLQRDHLEVGLRWTIEELRLPKPN